jgi:hypothetical protein
LGWMGVDQRLRRPTRVEAEKAAAPEVPPPVAVPPVPVLVVYRVVVAPEAERVPPDVARVPDAERVLDAERAAPEP